MADGAGTARPDAAGADEAVAVTTGAGASSAGVVAAGVAWTTENMFATLVVGMVTFWTAGTVL